MDIMSKFNLPSYVKGKSFSEASALIAKRFKDRTDPEAVETLNELQGRLQQAQEFVKSEQEKRTQPQVDASQSSAPAGAEGGAGASATEQFPEQPRDAGNNKFEGGGGLSMLTGLLGQKDTSGANGGAGAGSYIGAATTAMDLGKEAFGPTGIDTSGATAAPSVPSQGASAAMGAMKGAQAGMAFGPWGAAVGGVVGGAAGLIGGGKAKKDAEEASANFDSKEYNDATNRYKNGGSLLANMFQTGGDTDPDPSGYNPNEEDDYYARQKKFKEMGLDDATLDAEEEASKISDMNAFADSLPSASTYADESAKIANQSSKEIEASTPQTEAKFNPAELLRYAPAAMNAVQLAGLKKPEQIGLDRLGNTYEKQLVDERGLQNTVQESVNNTRNAILSSSGGSGSTARANLLASQLQGTKALSSAYQSAGAENRQENRKAQQFDLGVDQANMGQSNQETNLNLEQEAAYRTNKSKLMSQLGNDLGGVGREELFKKYPEAMGLSYNASGEHLVKKRREAAERKAARLAKRQGN